MQNYHYLAYDKVGRLQKGKICAESDKNARYKLKEQSLFVSEIRLVNDSSFNNQISAFFQRINNAELALIMQQLGVLVQSGMPLEEALLLLVSQSENQKQRRLVESWHSQILEGRSLSQSMQRSRFKVPDSVIASIAVGEETGHMDSILLRSAEELELGAENREAFKRGLSYPITLLVVAGLVVSIMMVKVVPKISNVFIHNNRELPAITETVIAISNVFNAYGVFALLISTLACLIIGLWLREDQNRTKWHRALLRLPVLGEWMRIANLADWARSLSALLASGVPALSALKISSAVMTNLSLRQQMEAVTNEVRNGARLHSALVKINIGQGFLQHMVGSGEVSSQLDSMLQRVSEYYTHRLRNSVDGFLKFMGPVLIVLLGGLVVVIVSAVMLPILDMNDMM